MPDDDKKIAEHTQPKALEPSVKNLVRTCEEFGVRLNDAERCIRGIAEELAKANARLDSVDADRDAMRKAFDQRFAEIVQAYEDAESAFVERLAQMAQHNMGLSKHNANLKQELKQSAADAEGSKD